MLTERVIRDASPKAHQFFIWDHKVKGLGLRVAPGGTKAFVFSYRTGGGDTPKQTVTLGRANDISLNAAREIASQERNAIRRGEPGPREKRLMEAAAPTVSQGLDRFFTEYAPRRMQNGLLQPRTVSEYRKQAEQTIRPAIGNLKIQHVNRQDIERATEHLAPVLRNRTLAFLSRLFTYFEESQWRKPQSNPARRVSRARENPRDRTLTDTELKKLAKYLDEAQERYPAPVAAIWFACYTGLRIGEILTMKWEHVDLDTERVLLPESKTGRRYHDLPPSARKILESLDKNGEFCFSTGRGKPSYSHVRKVFQECIATAKLSDIRIHDLRRTMMTRAAAAGLPTHILRDLLGHKTTAMADRYVRHSGKPAREARFKMGDVFEALMRPEEEDEAPRTEPKHAPQLNLPRSSENCCSAEGPIPV